MVLQKYTLLSVPSEENKEKENKSEGAEIFVRGPNILINNPLYSALW